MFRKSLTAVAGSAAIIAAGAAIAAPGGNGGGRGQGAANANVNAQTRINSPMNTQMSTRVNTNTSVNSNTTVNSNGSAALLHSQGPANASVNGIAHANQNSVLARGAVSSTALSGLATGLTVQNTSGTTLGTVSQVVTGSNGSIRLVVVTSPTGQTFRLAPSTLSVSGGVVTTTNTTIVP